ncbi:type II toxin-antitoxin system RelB family antitoxin [Pararhizobium sp.]|uniref:type II toxin-antitoxin system RelB family antitoxin n=1 Tax=Pararhizobium sp. TaxID=1977563 RepID=UPI00271A575E|nr:ribbon-helix-helix protein, CopG family [Pararhizobium sp.]MDO9415571.1 ribbon-helix-helix protein, CopG family [Pararhizobium sp.]
MLTLRLPADIDMQLDELAKRTGRSKSFHARLAILRYMDDIEDVRLAAHRLEEFRDGKEESVSLTDVMKQYGV